MVTRIKDLCGTGHSMREMSHLDHWSNGNWAQGHIERKTDSIDITVAEQT